MSEYNPDLLAHRTELATRFMAGLQNDGFLEIRVKSGCERVFAKTLSNLTSVLVYTSIVGSAVRVLDADAIRFAGIYRRKDGKERSLLPQMARVYRVGTIDRILERAQTRLHVVEDELNKVPTCRKCGAPMFKAQSGNVVCAEACWERK